MSETQENRELTFGEKLMGVNFNPEQHESVQRIKASAAAYADVLAEEAKKLPGDTFQEDMIERALFTALDSQMQAVKAVTWKF